MSNDLKYAEVIEAARAKLGVSIKSLAERMTELGHEISARRLEDMVYSPRRLNVRGMRRLEQIAETFRAIAQEQGKPTNSYEPHVLWPWLFDKPDAGTNRKPRGKAAAGATK